jgi:CheY-like chemotaxis protein
VSSEPSHATVLLVEDDDINQVVAQGMLEQLGYTVDVAADGIEAVEALRRRSYDVVLMDCGMPRLDGYSTTAHVRATETTGRHMPIIAMTAAALASDRQRCLDAGMDDYLSKPVTIEALAAALQRAGVTPSPPRVPTALVDVPEDGRRA